MSIKKDIPELLKAGVISQEIADDILAYYEGQQGKSQNRLFIAFGILGAILVGLGIILIIAHNWDNFSRSLKTVFAFLPLVVGQIICGYVLLKKSASVTWRESGTTFLFFAVGASISLVSQIYNLPGEVSAFLFIWMLLCLPLMYVMKSSGASLLYLVGIAYYGAQVGYWSPFGAKESYLYWALLFAALPYYYFLYQRTPNSNFTIFHNWLIPLSVIVLLGTVADELGQLMFVAYFSLFGLLYLIGDLRFFKQQRFRNHGYTILGSLGSTILLLILSFDWFWEELNENPFAFNEIIVAPEFWTATILSLLAIGLLYWNWKQQSYKRIQLMGVVFLCFILIFIIGLFTPLAVILINLLVLAIGILTIRQGAKSNHLGMLNYGLLMIAVLIACRFFDIELSFVARGIVFVLVGSGFFAANYWMFKKRRADEQ